MEHRKIIHIDMDAFFASVEQRDFPAYRGKPLAVGGDGKRGVVAAASYEARKFGVRSAMSSVLAKKKCPDLIFAPPRFDVYKEVSREIRNVFFEYTDLVEPLSLDEAYLDVTENKKGLSSAIKIAKQIKAEILSTTGLTASAGISFNKFLAKIASDLQKPNGLSVILPEQAQSFLDQLPIEKFHGIGKVTAEKMKAMGIYKGANIKLWPEEVLVARFGKIGSFFFRIAHGQDDREVMPSRIRKSLGAERTFEQDLTTPEEWLAQIQAISEKVSERLAVAQFTGRTLTLKIKLHDFKIITRSKTLPAPITKHSELFDWGTYLLQHPNWPTAPVRLLGLSVSNLPDVDFQIEGQQLKLPFEETL